tara:strand:- start:104645 stop:105208 length:564 start_codon:yes stop_codon:yes gene_type:complete
MKISRSFRAACALVALSLLAACVSAPAPAPRPAPKPAPPAPPPPAPEPVAKDWRDWPVAAGDWSYRAASNGSIASFGQPGQPPLLSFRCDRTTRRISVARATPLPPDRINGQMIVRTSFGAAQWPVAAAAQGGADSAYAVALRAGNDATFDQIAFSRGRFVIEAPGALPLAVPNWAEVSRVIEDCRG